MMMDGSSMALCMATTCCHSECVFLSAFLLCFVLRMNPCLVNDLLQQIAKGHVGVHVHDSIHKVVHVDGT